MEPAGQEEGGGQGKSSGAREHQPSWLAADRAGDCAARAPGAVHVSEPRWGWGLPRSPRAFSAPTEMGRDTCQGHDGCLRTPSFLGPGVARGFSAVLQENYCVNSKKDRVPRGL